MPATEVCAPFQKQNDLSDDGEAGFKEARLKEARPKEAGFKEARLKEARFKEARLAPCPWRAVYGL